MRALFLPRITIDFETRSVLDLADVGAWVYSLHATTSILFMAYAIEDQPAKLWAPYMPFPQELRDAVENDTHCFEAHSAGFEIAIWRHILSALCAIRLPKFWTDTMAVCAYKSLPLGLDEAGEALDLDIKKDKRGRYLITQLSKPRKPLKKEREVFKALYDSEDDWPILWREDPILMEEFGGYCLRDTESERELSHTIGDLPYSEYRIWLMDMRINNFGIGFDRQGVCNALKLVKHLEYYYNLELQQITENAVETANQRDKILAWLEEQGYEMPNFQKHTVEMHVEKFQEYVDEGATSAEKPLRVLQIRQAIGGSSVKKLNKFLACGHTDDRMRGCLQFHGAGTGRWAGRLIQPQNIPRGNLENIYDSITCDNEEFTIDDANNTLINVIKLAETDRLDDVLKVMNGLFMNDAPQALITSLRGMLKAAPGKVYRVADFSAIEAVITAWLAGEKWKVDAFRDIAAGKKYKDFDDIYCATASGVLEKHVTKKQKDDRYIGKVCELAFGYQGGIGAWKQFDKSGRFSDLEIDYFKDQWRDQHPRIKQLWYNFEEAAKEAIINNKIATYSGIRFETATDKAGKWLIITLRSGRKLWYFNPTATKYDINYWGRNNKQQGRWSLINTYGGMLTENIASATARDFMVAAMLKVAAAQYSICLTVHDEIVSEDDEDFGSLDEFKQLILDAVQLDWAKGCPVGISGWTGYRYRKD